MTPEELAQDTGYSRQTVNKWIKREGWSTQPKPGVQGGKARLIHIDEEVRNFLQSVRHVAEPRPNYQIDKEPLANIFLSTLEQMSIEEKNQLTALLLREGIHGVLSRLGIVNTEPPR